jgi:cysteine sulfinate desulfinase/cysteine desulfurase-like protein
VTFTGGGSEANNLAIKGVAFADGRKTGHVVTSSIEHPSVLNSCRWLEKRGFSVTYLPVDNSGQVDPEDLAAAITDETCLVTIMMANNETGAIQRIADMAGVAREHGVVFHTDAVQAVGKIPVDVKELGVDVLTLSGHKLHGPKGVGAIYARKGVAVDPLISGGHQEMGMRAGTENVMGIVGLGTAAEVSIDRLADMKRVREMRDRLERGILEIAPEAKINVPADSRLPNTLSVILPEIRGESLVIAMDEKGISISSGSACRAGDPEPSHALLAMGMSEDDAHCTVRFSLGRENTMNEIEKALESLRQIVKTQKAVVRFVSCR